MSKTAWKVIPGTEDTDYPLRVRAEYELSQLSGNQHPYFSLTGDIEEKRDGRWVEAGGGCVHEEILKAFPEFAPLAQLHLSDYPSGLPMHYRENALYHRDNYVKRFFDTTDIEAAVEEQVPFPDEYTVERWYERYATDVCNAKQHRWQPVLPLAKLIEGPEEGKGNQGARADHAAFKKGILDPLEAKRKPVRARLTTEHKDYFAEMKAFAHTVMLGLFDGDAGLFVEDPTAENKWLHELLTAKREKCAAWLDDRAKLFPAKAKEVAEKFGMAVSANKTGRPTMEEVLQDFEDSGLGQLCKEIGLTMTSVPTDKNPNMPDSKMYHHLCTLTLGQRQMRMTFSMGPGITVAQIKHVEYYEAPRPPHLGDIMECLISDSYGLESFEDWCANCGYDTDSRKAAKIYDACLEQNTKLKTLLGEHYERVTGQKIGDGAKA